MRVWVRERIAVVLIGVAMLTLRLAAFVANPNSEVFKISKREESPDA